jgi:5-methylcytosine-specific restriction protein A
MTREEFLKSVGAQSANKYWSWSAVNKDKKIVIFGAWDVHTKDGREMILNEDWKLSEKGKKQPGYTDAYRNLQLVEVEGYQLKTYPMILEEVSNGEWTRAKIKEFIPILHDRKLIKSGNAWYAVDKSASPSLFPDEEDLVGLNNGPEGPFLEGAIKQINVNAYERSASARKKCIEHHGCYCAVCELDFAHLYGELGKGFIHVHHIKPLSEIDGEYSLDPIKDLIPVCPNCHAMIHQTKPIKAISEMRRIVQIGKRNIESGVYDKK